MKQFYSTKEISTVLGITVAAVHSHLRRKNYDAVPPPVKLGRRLAWPVSQTNNWLKEKSTPIIPHKTEL